jgi:uncharacterized membrane protein
MPGLLILVLVIFCGYALHKLIRRFINPKQSASHLFLFFIAHFVGVFLLSFFLNLVLLKFSGFFLQP